MAKKTEMDQLTKDSISAQKAGMSYGKWKALHPHTDEVPKPAEEDSEWTRICPVCGKRFTLDGWKRKKYCGIECSYEVDRARCRDAYRRRKEEQWQLKSG